MEPLRPVSAGARIVLGVGFFALFVGVWALATYGGLVPPLFLASPGKTLAAGWGLLTEFGFAGDIAVTIWRVVGGFAIAAVIGVPLGLMMGAFKPVEAFFEPFISFARYLPASAFIPLLILWAGVGEAQKLSVIFIGSFFQVVIMVAVIAGGTRMDEIPGFLQHVQSEQPRQHRQAGNGRQRAAPQPLQRYRRVTPARKFLPGAGV